MINKDYRNTKFCPKLDDISEKKSKLELDITNKHPKQKIMYNKISDRSTQFNAEFLKIYNCKCAYCGVSINVLPSVLFEVDHYIAESAFISKIEAGHVKNLVLSCYQCNRNKREYAIKGKYIKQLNTDDGNIADVFYRDDKYYIRIEEKYKDDVIINEFYDKLKFVNQSRRLDYLLMNMKGLHKKLEGTVAGGKLAEAINVLQQKRNEYT